MKNKYLTVYDYGSGGIWQYISAESKEAITNKYPKLKVLDSSPSWWTPGYEATTNEYDIDCEPDEFLLLMMLDEGNGNTT